MSTPIVPLEATVVFEPELKYSDSGQPRLKFRIAASDSRKNDRDEWETIRSLFVNVTVFDGAETLAEKLQKGSRVIATGRLHEREYEHNGERKRSLELDFPMVQVLPDRRNQQPQPQQPAQGYGFTTPPAQGYGQQPDPWGAPAGNVEPVF